MRWSDDTRLISLEHFKEVAEYLYNLLDDDLKFIFRVRYASKEPKTAEEIATILGKEEKLIMPKIDRILELFADLMGD